MSIYPVKLIEWFPKRRRPRTEHNNYFTAFISVKYSECLYCKNEKREINNVISR